MILVLFGVSGAGKTVVGQALAQDLGWEFYDGDDFHPPSNIEKLRGGVALTDEDRAPWLEKLRALISEIAVARKNAVLACSALKKQYRDALRVSEEVKFVFLRGSPELIAGRLRERRGHFMKSDLLRSQFSDLEEPQASEQVLTVDITKSPTDLVREIETVLQLK